MTAALDKGFMFVGGACEFVIWGAAANNVGDEEVFSSKGKTSSWIDNAGNKPVESSASTANKRLSRFFLVGSKSLSNERHSMRGFSSIN